MDSIGSEIASGAMGALGKALGLVPIGVWLVLAFAILAAIFVVRYITNYKFVLPLVAVIFVLSEVMVWREHWIDMGYAEAQGKIKEAQTQMEGYKKTEALIEKCYATPEQVWDRTQGKCVREGGDGPAR